LDRKRKTREKILNAANTLFAELGYEGASTKKISNEAGINELTLFRHFKSKENLYLEMVMHFSPKDTMLRDIKQKISGNLIKDMKMLAKGFLANMVKNQRGVLMGLFTSNRFPEVKEIMVKSRLIHLKIVEDFFLYYENNDKLSIGYKKAAMIFIELLFGLSITLPIKGKVTSELIDSLVDDLVDVLSYGILKP